jgi:nucleoside-diphosphate-sugar epimerase
MNNSKNFWKNRKVLITGASGFVGSKLVVELASLGAKVIAVMSPRTDTVFSSNEARNVVTRSCDLSKNF